MSKSTTTANVFSRRGFKTTSSTKRQSSAISVHSSVRGTPKHIQAWLISLRQDSHANPFPLQGREAENATLGTCGLKPLNPFALYAPDLPYLKTCQVSFLMPMGEPFSGTWPKAGISVDGAFYQLQSWERRISAIGSGLWPTPTLTDFKGSTPYGVRRRDKKKNGLTLREWLAKYSKASETVYPHPGFLERIQGFPIGWTELKPLEMDKFQLWLGQSGKY